jgi:hypothetical protein
MSEPTKNAAKIISMEIAPPVGANLSRALDVARVLAAENIEDKTAVSFSLGAMRYTVQAEGALI